MEKTGVNAVFVPPEDESIKWFKERGFQVYVSVNAFGGKGAWKTYPDSRPIKADGSLLGSEPGYKGHGGVCPTHPEWRKERLKYVERLVRELGGRGGIDGVWLDFVRYPGLWEVPEPEIPDTCYCTRCLAKFQQDTGIKIPSGLDTKGLAAWIKARALYKWMEWKKEQIASFVSETRDVMKKNQGKKSLKLGLFLVPWTKGERGDAVSYLLAQDPFQLAALADVLSPMVYHRMCGRSPAWVGYMCKYYSETAKSLLWPIVEAVEAQSAERMAHSGISKGRGELGEVLRFAGQGGADGVLVYSYKGMGLKLWSGMKDFRKLPNLIRRGQSAKRMAHSAESKGSTDYPSTICRSYGAGADYTDERLRGLEGEKGIGIEGKKVRGLEGRKGIGVTAKDEWGAEWVAPLPECEPGAEYVFRGDLFRKGWRNGVYPAVSIWGEEFLVDTHIKAKIFQSVRVNVTCPNKSSDPYFRFINRNRNTPFWLTQPSLKRNYRFQPEPAISIEKWFFPGGFFPIGVYGADLENLEQIKRLAINTVLLGGSGEALKYKIERCHKVGLRYVLSVPHDPDKLPVFLNEISPYVRPHDLAFYVNDEPGIWSFPVNRADDINRLIKDRFPACATCMAVVRPQVCRDFEWAVDFFMLDQYPVPYMPMTWLSDCMDECAGGVTQSAKRIEHRAKRIGQGASGRLASVIQAFGGKKWTDVGWPRLPTWQEMDCLAFLSVVHGSRGVFFYTYSIMGKNEQGRERLGRVVGRLNRVYPWLVVENSGERVEVEMLSKNRLDPKGRPAVHCCLKRKGNELMVIAVNTIGTHVEAVLGAEGRAHSAEREAGDSRITNQQITNTSAKRTAREVFSGEDYPLVDGKIRVRFRPYESKAFLFRIAQSAEREAQGAKGRGQRAEGRAERG